MTSTRDNLILPAIEEAIEAMDDVGIDVTKAKWKRLRVARDRLNAVRDWAPEGVEVVGSSGTLGVASPSGGVPAPVTSAPTPATFRALAVATDGLRVRLLGSDAEAGFLLRRIADSLEAHDNA